MQSRRMFITSLATLPLISSSILRREKPKVNSLHKRMVSYSRGDLIHDHQKEAINTWVCVESGTPGKFELYTTWWEEKC